MNRFTIVQEVGSDYHRILESYPTSDGIRSRICDWRGRGYQAAKTEVKRRLKEIEG